MNLPLQPISEEIILKKFAKGVDLELNGLQATESIRKRVSKGLASCENDPEYWESAFYDAQVNNGVIMAGRGNSAAGTDINATLINVLCSTNCRHCKRVSWQPLGYLHCPSGSS